MIIFFYKFLWFFLFKERTKKSISHLTQRIVVFHPVGDLNDAVIGLAVADHDPFDARIDDHSLAHLAAGGIGNVFTRFGVNTAKEHGSADHLLAGSIDNGVLLRVHASAKLVTLAAGNIQLLTQAKLQITAILSASGCPYVAGGYDHVVFHDDRAVFLSQAGAALCHRLGNIQIIIFFRRTIGHGKNPPFTI